MGEGGEVPKMSILGSGVTGGVTKWGYIFQKVGLQKWVFRGGFIEGEKYHIFKIGGKNRGYRCRKKLGFLLLFLFAFSENQVFTTLWVGF